MAHDLRQIAFWCFH